MKSARVFLFDQSLCTLVQIAASSSEPAGRPPIFDSLVQDQVSASLALRVFRVLWDFDAWRTAFVYCSALDMSFCVSGATFGIIELA